MENGLFFKNKTILITGGTGSWGNELTLFFLKKQSVKEIRIYSRDEYKQVKMKRKFQHNPKLKFIVGDVRNNKELTLSCMGVDFIFHLAALKHVPVCEDNVWETISTNIIGTQNVIEASIANRVSKVIYVSTDKAVEPYNLYGMTKACGEKLITSANKYYRSSTKFITIRSGNVLGTRGSVLPLFIEQITTDNKVTLTDEQMTRYFINSKVAINLIIEATKLGVGGEIFVLKMPATDNLTLIKTIIKMFGNEKTKIIKVGPRPGEKRDEVLISKHEVPYSRIINDKLFVILDQRVNNKFINKYYRLKRLKDPEYTSKNTFRLESRQIEKLLIEEGVKV
ncbi:hypothetical protein A2954_04340 [Candidatus Roizmanbacteria bacterium RIFCSPLOWO2_01_FULL_37_12]|uniref:Polysaccharide biosynthesis protein CapD-like domain-containing protein n=1 Tax=Candidatus Roizmanbacteria bacterium RIFCSPLOWO2_01_FULL_37_12 TaxID=1802056 RepID=A0A1F7IFT4_9BACT|nr:MAG: hypothetical protein A3D76_06250 [Candidatus Roizmanbacteria bacterium RIFCSPHIGHO2_02_FULL_37_9b]OGK42213.1 MAG: hypothetical protein A2954_04340 [Candidatus Roizmanbacteria bacterium RIFCSPLOWO2_01_FULL_37_12]